MAGTREKSVKPRRADLGALVDADGERHQELAVETKVIRLVQP